MELVDAVFKAVGEDPKSTKVVDLVHLADADFEDALQNSSYIVDGKNIDLKP